MEIVSVKAIGLTFSARTLVEGELPTVANSSNTPESKNLVMVVNLIFSLFLLFISPMIYHSVDFYMRQDEIS